MVQGNTVSALGPFNGLKEVRTPHRSFIREAEELTTRSPL